jgi:succinoglycan biosynthesis protein ExoA
MDDPVIPIVSIVVPCYNEQSTIRLLLDALYAQTYPCSELEVIIADGRSTDRTREQIAAFQVEHPDLKVRVVDNRKRTIPAGLNCAIAAAQGRFIVRLDAHSAPDPDYVARCVADLLQGRGDVVGGFWEIQPRGKSWQARSIVVAAAHPLGVGDVRYRLGGHSQLVDTVPFGAFLRALVERVGPFDETLLTTKIMSLIPACADPGERCGLTLKFARRISRHPPWSRWRASTGVMGFGRCACCAVTRLRSAGDRPSRRFLY